MKDLFKSIVRLLDDRGEILEIKLYRGGEYASADVQFGGKEYSVSMRLLEEKND